MSIKFKDGYVAEFLGADDYTGAKAHVSAAHKMLEERSGLGNDF